MKRSMMKMTSKEIDNMIKRINSRMQRLVETLGPESGAYQTYLSTIREAESFYGLRVNREGTTAKIERSKSNITRAQEDDNSMKMLEHLDKKTRNQLSGLMATARKELKNNPAFGPQRKTPLGRMDRRDIVQRAKMVDYVNYWIDKRLAEMYVGTEQEVRSEEEWQELYELYSQQGFGADKGFSYEDWYIALRKVEGI